MKTTKRYRVIYRLDTGLLGRFTDVELIVDHLPDLGTVVIVPDGSDKYGRVISVERVRD
jgi:hypothetical protein